MVPSLSFLVPKVAVWGMEMQTCSLNFLALTVGVLVETPIYFLSFLVPKAGDGDVHPSWSYGFQPEQGWIAQYCCFWNHLHQYAIC
jgi:hypothetical protein